MDDAQTLASTEERSLLAQSKLAKTLSYLGLQDAAQERRMGSKQPGVWVGEVVATDKDVVVKLHEREIDQDEK